LQLLGRVNHFIDQVAHSTRQRFVDAETLIFFALFAEHRDARSGVGVLERGVAAECEGRPEALRNERHIDRRQRLQFIKIVNSI
jgi:hypothetical protein